MKQFDDFVEAANAQSNAVADFGLATKQVDRTTADLAEKARILKAAIDATVNTGGAVADDAKAKVAVPTLPPTGPVSALISRAIADAAASAPVSTPAPAAEAPVPQP